MLCEMTGLLGRREATVFLEDTMLCQETHVGFQRSRRGFQRNATISRETNGLVHWARELLSKEKVRRVRVREREQERVQEQELVRVQVQVNRHLLPQTTRRRLSGVRSAIAR